MLRLGRIRWVACCATILVLAACGGSTGPSARVDAASLAAHFDSIARRQCPPPSSNPLPGPLPSKCSFLFAARAVVGEGVSPGKLTITTSIGSGIWMASILRQVYSANPGVVDTTFILIAYDGPDLTHALLMQLPQPGVLSGTALLDDSVTYTSGTYFYPTNGAPAADKGTGSVAQLGLEGACVPVDSARGVPFPNVCRSGVFAVSVADTLIGDGLGFLGITNPKLTIAIPTQDVVGIVADSTGSTGH